MSRSEIRQLIMTLIALTCLLSESVADDVHVPSNVVVRSQFENARIQFELRQTGHVAFMGGSITEMNGYRPMVTAFLQKRFPATDFQFTDAGISSTCSTAGAFRLSHDVLSHGEVDLFFVEFAVNDDQDAGHSFERAVRGMEGILRQVRMHSPFAEIFVTYFLNPGMLEKLNNGETPVSIAAHERVADRYGASTIHLAQEVSDQIRSGTLTWKQFGGTHPAPMGNAIPARMITQTLESAWQHALPTDAQRVKRPVPESLVETNSYVRGQYVPHANIHLGTGWEFKLPNWDEIDGSVRARHRDQKLFTCAAPGSELSFSFHGTAVGVECVAGPDAGYLEYSLDGKAWRSLNLSHRFSKGLHYPRTVLFADEIADEPHSIRVRLSDQQSDYGHQPVARILNFVINGTPSKAIE